MKLRDLVNILQAKVITGESHLDREVEYAFSSDMMSDVLTVEMRNILLITGMANIQAMRTAEMSDAQTVLLVRNKKASPEMKEIAKQNDMVLMEFNGSMFRASGILYNAGLKPVY
jgi:hypothetical protein